MDKMKAMKAYMASKRASMLKEQEVSEMQVLLHKYFDLQGIEMSKAEIEKVHQFIQDNMVFTNETEAIRYLTMMSYYSQSGADTIPSERASILARMNKGEVVSKTDASIVSKNIIIYLKQVSYFNNNDEGLKVEHIIRPQKSYCISVDPDAEKLLTRKPFTRELDSIVRSFETVKAQAFPSSVMDK